ncbi:hypothetical protein ACGTN6_12790 [Halomonas sp. THAF12]
MASEDDTLVAGLLGVRHLVNGHAVPHQLADQGVSNTGSLLP